MPSNWFDPHKGLLQLWVLRISIAFLTISAAAMTALIVWNSPLYWQLGYSGFNEAVNIFKVPLGILALIIPIVALLAANHRSEQAKEQMRIASSQNVFANHYKHLEEFEKFFVSAYERMKENAKLTKERFEKHSKVFQNTEINFEPAHVNPACYRKLYRKIYPDSRRGDLIASRDFLASIDDFATRILNYSDAFGTDCRDDWLQSIRRISKEVDSFVSQNHIVTANWNIRTKLNIDGEIIRVPGGDVSCLLQDACDAVFALDKALEFDIAYVPSDLVRRVVDFDYEKLPQIDVDEDIKIIQPFSLRELLKAT